MGTRLEIKWWKDLFSGSFILSSWSVCSRALLKNEWVKHFTLFVANELKLECCWSDGELGKTMMLWKPANKEIIKAGTLINVIEVKGLHNSPQLWSILDFPLCNLNFETCTSLNSQAKFANTLEFFYVRNEINGYLLSSDPYHYMHRSSASSATLLMEDRARSLIGVMVGPQSKIYLVVLCV